MQFLADENFPYPSVRLLRAAGLDVHSIQESAASITDPEVMALAIRLNRVILTFDRDYGELVYRYNHRPPAGIVYFRWDHYQPEEPGRFLLTLMQTPDFALGNTFLVVMPNNQLRSSTY